MEIEGRMFKCNAVKEAIRDTRKSKALGPDRTALLHHINPIALSYLTDIINSKQLGTPPPKIAEEQTMPLIARIRLTQLRI